MRSLTASKLLGATALAFVLMTGAAAAQTTYDASATTDTATGTATDTSGTMNTTGTDVTNVGTPNTGAGGTAAETALVLGSAAALALLGGTYLGRTKKAF